ncbi:MAG TPA: MraY family glycosyltransferase [Caulobacteraceae bacterium]|jgi:UDP-GlcNAc:undecaprenyl-phosphate GlcNAc-1-phosphate transferase|nr:MraY family glycosyltransferase [Caulobacteraceae bacterium]
MEKALSEVGRGGLEAAAAAFILTVLLIPLLVPLARRVGLVDHPGGRKTHAAATPMVGGVAIALVSIPLALVMFHPSAPLLGLGAATLILLPAGVLDDRYNLNWVLRLAAQSAAALAMIYVGGVRVELIGSAFGLAHHTLGMLSVPFTVIATVGLINALNMADGVDGLVGGLTLAALAMLTAAAVYSGAADLACVLVLMMGSTAGFLVYNLRTPLRPRAHVFIGAGSEFLGLLIAWASFRLTQNPAHPVSPVLAPFLVAPPVVDCLVLIARRLRSGRSPFSADRNHIHHLLLDAGFSTTGAVSTLVALSVGLGAAAALAMHAHVPQGLFVTGFLGLTAAHYGLTSRRERSIGLLDRLARVARRPGGRTAVASRRDRAGRDARAHHL